MILNPTGLVVTQATAMAANAGTSGALAATQTAEFSPDSRSRYVLAGGAVVALAGCSEPSPQPLQHQPAHTGHQTALEACRESLHMARADRHQDDQGLFAAVLIGAVIFTGISSTVAYFLGRRSGRKSQQKQAPATDPAQTPKADGK